MPFDSAKLYLMRLTSLLSPFQVSVLLYESCLEFVRSFFGDRHFITMNVCVGLAFLLSKMNRAEEALQMLDVSITAVEGYLEEASQAEVEAQLTETRIQTHKIRMPALGALGAKDSLRAMVLFAKVSSFDLYH